MPVKLAIPDKRMLELMTWALANALAENEGHYWEQIGFHRNSLSKIRTGSQSFTVAQITAACKLTNASADWVLGLSTAMFSCKEVPALTRIKQAVAQLEQERRR